MEALGIYLKTRWPEGLVLDDAVQLCMHIYSHVGDIPPALQPMTSRERLARSFSELAASGWIRQPAAAADISGVEFWVTVVASVKKQWPWRYDHDEARIIAARFDAAGSP